MKVWLFVRKKGYFCLTNDKIKDDLVNSMASQQFHSRFGVCIRVYIECQLSSQLAVGRSKNISNLVQFVSLVFN